MAENTKFSKKGEKVTEEFCPHCKDKLVVSQSDGESEVFECVNCKFKISKKRK